MNIITIRFTSKWPPNPISLVIARLSGSREFSHSMNIIEDVVYEATMQHGCRVIPIDVAMSGVAMYQDMYVPVPDLAAAIAWGNEQNGKDYDFAGAFGLPFLASENWEDDSSWWCSEHNFMQIRKGGADILDPDVNKRVTPAHLRMCNYKKSEIIRIKQ